MTLQMEKKIKSKFLHASTFCTGSHKHRRDPNSMFVLALVLECSPWFLKLKFCLLSICKSLGKPDFILPWPVCHQNNINCQIKLSILRF